MRVDNQTAYDGRKLKSLITAAHDHLADAEGRYRRWKATTFTIVYTRTRTASGHAWYNSTRARLRLARPDSRRGPVNAGQVVRIAWHEILHLYGYSHDQMARMYPGWNEVDEMVEAAGFSRTDSVPLKPSAGEDQDPEPTEAEKAREKFAHALEKRKEWTAKAKRAKTYLAKWRKRENRARRRLEDLGEDPDAIREDVLGDYQPAMAGDIRIS